MTHTSTHQADRGIFELGRGRPLHVTDAAPESRRLVAAVESLRPDILAMLRRANGADLRLAVTPHRAHVLGLSSAGRPTAMSLAIGGDADRDALLCLASAGDRSRGSLEARAASAPEVGGMALARLGRLLPSVVSVSLHTDTPAAVLSAVEQGDILTVTTAQIEELERDTRIEVVHVSEGPVPLAEAEEARLVLFREVSGILEHVAVVIGDRDQWPDPVPVRLHSACLTGDILGSLRCDCGDQLRGSLRACAQAGGGLVLYLAQEGRGIGLANKLRAYSLQQQGLDTIDADCTLGFGADERHYAAAVAMLQYLKVARVLLLTNNPHKVRALREGGIRVLDRLPLYGALNAHNLPYVEAKVHRAGHWLAEMLAEAAPSR